MNRLLSSISGPLINWRCVMSKLIDRVQKERCESSVDNRELGTGTLPVNDWRTLSSGRTLKLISGESTESLAIEMPIGFEQVPVSHTAKSENISLLSDVKAAIQRSASGLLWLTLFSIRMSAQAILLMVFFPVFLLAWLTYGLHKLQRNPSKTRNAKIRFLTDEYIKTPNSAGECRMAPPQVGFL